MTRSGQSRERAGIFLPAGARILAKQVGARCRERGLTVAVAESCTGGLLGHAITSVAGSSDYFLGGVIAYANEVKVRELGVRRATLARDGAVSRAVALEMAAGARERFRADIGVGVTGIAGPGGGTARKPVGLVFVAVASRRGAEARRFRFGGGRDAVKGAACRAALAALKGCAERA